MFSMAAHLVASRASKTLLGCYYGEGCRLGAEPAMKKLLFVFAALVATTLLDSRPSHAYYEGAWCAVSSMGRGGVTENCTFMNFERCRMEIIAGNRGFCRQNSRFPGWYSNYAAGPGPRKARKRYRY
jgi:hypothetical protein